MLLLAGRMDDDSGDQMDNHSVDSSNVPNLRHAISNESLPEPKVSVVELKIRLDHDNIDYTDNDSVSSDDNGELLDKENWKERWEYYIRTFPYNRSKFDNEWDMVERFVYNDQHRRVLKRLFLSAIGECQLYKNNFALLVSAVWEAFHFLIFYGAFCYEALGMDLPWVRLFDDLIDDRVTGWNTDEEEYIKKFLNIHVTEFVHAQQEINKSKKSMLEWLITANPTDKMRNRLMRVTETIDATKRLLQPTLKRKSFYRSDPPTEGRTRDTEYYLELKGLALYALRALTAITICKRSLEFGTALRWMFSGGPGGAIREDFEHCDTEEKFLVRLGDLEADAFAIHQGIDIRTSPERKPIHWDKNDPPIKAAE